MSDDTRGIGDNGGPPLKDRTFKKRWAMAVFCHPKKPAGAVAMAFKLYMEMDSEGKGAAIPDMEFAACCGVSDRSVREFKTWLVNNGFVKIIVKGARGRVTVFAAQIPNHAIPAMIAGIQAGEVPAPTAGKLDEYRQEIPAILPELPAMVSGILGVPAAIAGSVPTVSPARIEPPSGVNNIIKQPTTTTVESEADGGSGGFDFDVLNGTAINLVAFISKHNQVEKTVARNMLATNVKTFGAEAIMEAFAITMAEAGSGLVAKPYKYLIETARNLKNGKARRTSKAAEPPGPSRRDRFRQYVEEAQSKQEPRVRHEQ